MKKYTDPISKSLFAISKKYQLNNSGDLYALYIEIQNKYRELIKEYPNVKLDSFELPQDNGNRFLFKFNESHTDLYDISEDGTKEHHLTKDYQSTKLMQAAMDGAANTMRVNKIHLGEKPSKEFTDSLFNANKGDIFVYNTGFTLLVKDRDVSELSVAMSVNHIDGEVVHSEIIEKPILLGKDADMREIFYAAKDNRTDFCEVRVTDHHSVLRELENLVLNLEDNDVKKIIIGDDCIIGQKLDKSIHWMDKNGNSISTDTAVRTYAWAKFCQVDIDVLHKDPKCSLLDEYQGYEKLEQLQIKLAQKNPEQILDDIQTILNNNESMSFSIKSLNKVDDDFIKTNFVFLNKYNQLYIFKTEPDKSLVHVSPTAFLQFYQEKYNDHLQVFYKSAFETVAKTTTKETSFSETKNKINQLTQQLMDQMPIEFDIINDEGISKLAEALVDERNLEEEDIEL